MWLSPAVLNDALHCPSPSSSLSGEVSDLTSHLRATRRKLEEIEREKLAMSEEGAGREKVWCVEGAGREG